MAGMVPVSAVRNGRVVGSTPPDAEKDEPALIDVPEKRAIANPAKAKARNVTLLGTATAAR